MRLIVDLFQYIIIGLCGLAIVSAVILIMAVVDPSHATPAWMSVTVITGLGIAFVFLVANLGLVATLLSLHDRHAALVDEAIHANELLERYVAAVEQRRGQVVPQ